MSLAPGTQIDRYTIEALIGEGAMGMVYRAFDSRLRRTVAIKVLATSGHDDVAGALREARAAAGILHPNVTAVFDADRAGDTSFIVMELVPGTSLRRFVGDASMPLGVRARWLLEIAGALAAAHRAGIVHRDVKPENVIVRDDGLVKVLDFGIARPLGAERNTPAGGALTGTPAYMAPEQIRGADVDARADQFAWAVLAYELLTGRLPWPEASTPLARISAVISADPAPIPAEQGVPIEIVAALRRALAKSRDDRFPTIADAASALSPFAGARSELTEALGEAFTMDTPKPPPEVMPPAFEEQVAPSAASVPPPGGPPASGDSCHRTLASVTAPSPASDRSGLRFADPDFEARVDVDAHLALLPPLATVKGMFFIDLLKRGSTVIPPEAVFDLAGITPRRYLVFGDYPASDSLRLTVAVAMVLHPTAPLGEALRRVGQTAFDTVAASLFGRTLFGVFGRDLEPILLAGPRAYKALASFGEVTIEKTGPGTFLFHACELPLFLSTYHVGVIEGVLRHCGKKGRLRVASASLSEASIELTVV